MKKIVSIALFVTLCSAPLMNGMDLNKQPPVHAKSGGFTGTSFTSSPSSSSAESSLLRPAQANQSGSNWKRHLRTGAWTTASGVFGLFWLGAGMKSLGSYQKSKDYADRANEQAKIADLWRNHSWQSSNECALRANSYYLASAGYNQEFGIFGTSAAFSGIAALLCGKMALKSYRGK